MGEKFDWLRLIRSDNVGPITFYKLLERFGTAKAALDALPDLAKHGGAKRVLKACPKDQIKREIETLENLGGTLITRAEDTYPPLLAHIDDAPPVLSVLGHVHLLRKRTISVIGARNASLNGCNFARRISMQLGQSGLLVASGLARGLDAAAHQGSLATGTIAVVGGGVDVVYPKENDTLYNDIKNQGTIISEVAIGTQPIARHFPRRNRLISGLARGTVVVEASLRSGSLITARMALEQNREVFAVPGAPSDPRAQGCNRLIKQGAHLIQNVEDILEVLNTPLNTGFQTQKPLDYQQQQQPLPDDQELNLARSEIQIMLSPSPVTVDELVRNCQFSPSTVSLVLLEMELAGRLERHAGNRVARLET